MTRESISSRQPRSARVALGIVLVLATLLAYWSVLDNELTNWDDQIFVLSNPYIADLSLANLEAIFTSIYPGFYHPLTLLSLAADHALGGFEPAVYHRTSLLLHVLTTLVVFAIAREILPREFAAFFVALLFGVHPLHVEPVAWVAARKDVLFALFFFCSFFFYLRHCRDDPQRPGRMYWLALICFALSLLSKAQAASLAPTLVAVDLFRGRNPLDKRVLLEKLPFFALALGLGLLALIAQRDYAGQYAGEFVWSLGERLVFACYGLARYLLLAIAPHDLAAFYPYPHPSDAVDGLPATYLLCVPVVLAAIGVFAWSLRRAPILAFSIAFFTINVALMLQLLPNGLAIMADRYSYVPSFGIFLALAAGTNRLLERWPRWRIAIAVLALAYAATLSLVTHRQCDVWQDSASLWNDVLDEHPEASVGLLNRAMLRYRSGDLVGAEADLAEMVRLWPLDAKAYGQRAVIRHETGDDEGALSDLGQAIALQPSPGFYVNRGSLHVARGDLRQALRDFSAALALDDMDVRAWSKRGWTRGEVGDPRGALSDYQVVVKLAPEWAEGHLGIGYARMQLGEHAGARESLDRAIELAPSLAAAHLRRAELNMIEGRKQPACRDFARATRLGARFTHPALSQYCGR